MLFTQNTINVVKLTALAFKGWRFLNTVKFMN